MHFDPAIYSFEKIIAGFKVHPRLQKLHPASSPILEIIDLASDMGKPIIFDTFMQSSTILISFLDPMIFDGIAKSNPDVTFILAHACWPHLIDAYIVAKSNSNVYLDLSYFGILGENLSFLNDFCRLLNKLDQKVIFGSDFPEVNLLEYTGLWKKKLCDLKEEKINNIFFQNACEVFNL